MTETVVFFKTAWCLVVQWWHLFATQQTITIQAPPSKEFSKQEYWSVLPRPSPGDLTDSRGSYWLQDLTQVSCIAGEYFTVWATRETAKINHHSSPNILKS